MRHLLFAIAALLLLTSAAPAQARLVQCVGRCDDGSGNGMVVESRCDDATERCEAGCDKTGPRPYPYAECAPKTAPDAAGTVRRDQPRDSGRR